jgi:hypothetical protein
MTSVLYGSGISTDAKTVNTFENNLLGDIKKINATSLKNICPCEKLDAIICSEVIKHFFTENN